MSKETPLVSILICNYNYGQYIKESLNSALSQDYKNIEIIIIDDGSKDESVVVVESCIKNNPNKTIKLVAKKKNEGLCYARNDALAMVSGEYFVFLDSDDTMPDDYISSLYETLVQKNADVTYGDTISFGDETGVTNQPEYSIGELLIHNFVNISALVKSSKIGDQKFDTKLNRKTLEDYDFWLGLGLRGLKFVKANDVYLNYRVQNESRNDNSSRLDTRVLNFVKVWLYSIDKYRELYKNKIPDNIVIKEFEYQIGQIGKELYDLNDVVHDKLMPELEKKEHHIEYLEKTAQEYLERSAVTHSLNEQLKASLEYRIGGAILRPLRRLKGVLKK